MSDTPINHNYITCPKCGVWYEALYGHMCLTQMSNMMPSITYNYKCPSCCGEFNEPATDGMSINSHGNPRCPFCGKHMEGLK